MDSEEGCLIYFIIYVSIICLISLISKEKNKRKRLETIEHEKEQEQIKQLNDQERLKYTKKTILFNPSDKLFKKIKENFSYLSEEYCKCSKKNKNGEEYFEVKTWETILSYFSDNNELIFDYEKFNNTFLIVKDFYALKWEFFKEIAMTNQAYLSCFENGSLQQNIWEHNLKKIVYATSCYSNFAFEYDYTFFNACFLEALEESKQSDVVSQTAEDVCEDKSAEDKKSVGEPSEKILSKYFDKIYVPYRVDKTHLKRIINLVDDENDRQCLLSLKKENFEDCFDKIAYDLTSEYTEEQIRSLKDVVESSMDGLSMNFEKCFSSDEYHIKIFDDAEWKKHIQYFQNRVLDDDYSPFIITKVFLDAYLGN